MGTPKLAFLVHTHKLDRQFLKSRTPVGFLLVLPDLTGGQRLAYYNSTFSSHLKRHFRKDSVKGCGVFLMLRRRKGKAGTSNYKEAR